MSADKPIKSKQSKRGRKKIEFTEQQWSMIDNMCRIQCTGEEIASVLGCDYDTFAARVVEKTGAKCSEYIKQRAMSGNASLRREQFELAKKGNPTMLIWLGKQYLGQKDQTHSEITGANNGAIEVIKSDMSAEDAINIYKTMLAGK